MLAGSDDDEGWQGLLVCSVLTVYCRYARSVGYRIDSVCVQGSLGLCNTGVTRFVYREPLGLCAGNHPVCSVFFCKGTTRVFVL